MSILKVSRRLPVAKKGAPDVEPVDLKPGEYDLARVPKWAADRLVEKGAAQIVKGKASAKDDEAVAKAKAEQEAASKTKASGK